MSHFVFSTSSDWTWLPTSWRRFHPTRSSCGSRCTPRWRDPPSRHWCWVLVGTLCTVTASWSGFADWPERMTWRRVLHQKIWLGNTSGLSERYGPRPRRKRCAHFLLPFKMQKSIHCIVNFLITFDVYDRMDEVFGLLAALHCETKTGYQISHIFQVRPAIKNTRIYAKTHYFSSVYQTEIPKLCPRKWNTRKTPRCS